MVYGDILSFFAEQFRMLDYYSMTALPVGSYSKRVDLGKVKGVFQYMKKGELARENDTEAETDVPTFWTRQKLAVGNFLQKEDELYRIVGDYTWKFEGGFYCYTLETFIGNSDSQKPFEHVNIGQDSYA